MSLIKKAIKASIPYGVYSPVQTALRYLSSFRYPGDAYTCPFCQGRFSTLLPAGSRLQVLVERQVIGGGYRPCATCPRCYSTDRERLVHLYLTREKAFVFRDAISVLHVAPERNLSKFLRTFANITYRSGDLGSPLADVKMDITDIPDRDNSHDVVICNHVLEHIPDDRRAMAELWRVLKPGGFAILQVPISHTIPATIEDFSKTTETEREAAFGQRDHVRIYGPDYPQRLASVGFSVRAYDHRTEVDRGEAARLGLLDGETIFVCTKSA